MPIRAPTAGILLEQAEVQPRVVTAGTPLAAVGNPADLEVLVPVLTTDVPRIREGATVHLRLTSEIVEEERPARATVSSSRMPDAMTGRVKRIEPMAFTSISALGVEEQRVYVVVALPGGTSAVPRLGDRFRLHASITVWEDAEALRVPVSALVREGTEWSVWVLANGRARRRVIRVGERGAAFAPLLSGLVSGEVVVTYPGESVRDGARLRQAPSR
jgi:HlyD family secretion protein